MQKSEAEKLKVAEAKLEKQTMDWLVAQEQLKKLAEETSNHVGKANETLEEFGRVKKLLSDVRSELVSSQKALASSRQKMEGQDQLLERQLTELEEQRRSVMSYMKSLRDAEVEVESERVKLRVAEARTRSLKGIYPWRKSLLKEIDDKSAAFEQTQTLLKAKESELVEARLEIQQLRSGHASLQLVLEEKNLELSDAKKMLEEVNQEIAELKGILFSREDELHQAIFAEAETVVEKIVDLTKEVVLSFNEEGCSALSPLDHNNVRLPPPLLYGPADGFKWQKKQLEAELEFTRQSLRAKEMEILAAEKALTIKDEELKMVLQKLDAREKEITELKREMMQDKDDLRQLNALAQERIGEKSVGDLAIEKLQLEAAQLEVEAATNALQKITEMSRELLNKAGLTIEADYDTSLFEQNGSEARINAISDNECPAEVKSELSRLLTLTEQLVKEAGIAGDTSQ
ncbi:UNVERIFIED_CONTAM: hypothetical protein Sradi_5575700 [Sesamum radiatum]|uniref:Uncharacterized protein n=1 Tax=Sesamum radiatum TaxID=300843 RepID=A0AAW2KZ21_SESRA